jgi:hypothetical protein
MRNRIVLSLALLALVIQPVVMFGAQGTREKLTTDAKAQISAGLHSTVTENLPQPVHPVLLEWRHCQKYADPAECAKDPSTLFKSELTHNLRTNAGADAQASQMGNTATQAASCNYIALTNDSGAPAATDTTVASEIAANGLSRAQGTYAHTTGTAVFTVQKVFSATGTQASQKTGLLNASSSGTLCFEAAYTAVTVNNGDTLTVTWTINY